MTHCKRSWNLVFTAIFSTFCPFDTVFLASPQLGHSSGTLPYSINKSGKTEINFNDFLLLTEGGKILKKLKKTCPNSESTFFALFLWQKETYILLMWNVILPLASIDIILILWLEISYQNWTSDRGHCWEMDVPKVFSLFVYLSFHPWFYSLRASLIAPQESWNNSICQGRNLFIHTGF